MKKYYINKKTATLKVLKLLGVSLLALTALYVINLALIHFFDYIVVPHILVIPALYLVVYIYRFLWLLILPEVILKDNSIKWFGIIWYKTRFYNDIKTTIFDNDSSKLFITAINEKNNTEIDFEYLNAEDVNEIVLHLKNNGMMTSQP